MLYVICYIYIYIYIYIQTLSPNRPAAAAGRSRAKVWSQVKLRDTCGVSGGRATLLLKHWAGVGYTRSVSCGRAKLSLTHWTEAKDTGGVSGGWDMHSLDLVSCWLQSLKRSNIYMLYAICYMLYVICYIYIYIYICYMLYVYIYIYIYIYIYLQTLSPNRPAAASGRSRAKVWSQVKLRDTCGVSGGRATLLLKHWAGVRYTRSVSGGRVKLPLTHCLIYLSACLHIQWSTRKKATSATERNDDWVQALKW